MNFVLDTNIILFYLKSESVSKQIDDRYQPFLPGNNPIISIVTVAEIYSMALQHDWGAQRRAAVDAFIGPHPDWSRYSTH